MRRAALPVVAILTLLVMNAQASPGPGPGEPFGGDDSGCVPPSSRRLSCSSVVARAFEKLESAVVKCHARQAKARFSTVVLGRPKTFDEEACKASAAERFDDKLAKLSTAACEGSTLLLTATADRAALGVALESRNGDVHCDPSSDTPIDPGGDDGGYVPATDASRRCADRVARNLRSLAGSIWRCSRRHAQKSFALADPAYDEEACDLAALVKFDAAATRLLERGLCPPCLGAAEQQALALAVATRLDTTNASTFPCADPVLHVGTPELDRPTLMTLGIRLPVTGDEDYDASIAVRYRPVGAPVWSDALPLMRVRPESVEGRTVAEQFAGSIFDLRPATAYEIELHATDSDGGVDETLMLTASTRAVPADPVSPRVVSVSSTAALDTALQNAQAGDVIEIANGVYDGPFILSASGTALNPIVLRGASRDGTILDGDHCDCNVLEVYGSFVHVEQLSLRNAHRALRFQTTAAEGCVVRRVHAYDTELGFGSRQDQRDFYICDNLLEGPLEWPHVYFDDNGAYSDIDGILAQGFGHVVCHNQLVGYGDALKNLQPGSRALDFYGNEVLSAYDNAIELDHGEGNVRAFRNRFTNTFVPLSFQPLYGGPAYALRNVVVNVAHSQLKFHGIGGATGPSGVLVYHNTFVSPDTPLRLWTTATSHHFEIANNLFVGPAALADSVVEWLGPIDDGKFDYNGYFPDGVFRFNLPPVGLTSYADFGALQAGGMEANGVLLAQPVFANGLVAPADYTATLAPPDVTLAASSVAVDAGGALPNINDAASGAGPDLGALERGCPLPLFGIRPQGIDESNQPLGCAP